MERVETVEKLLQDSKQIRHNRAEKGRKVLSGVSDDAYGPEGREFESLRAYQNPRETLCFLRVLSCFRNLSDVSLFFDHGSDPYGKSYRTAQDSTFPIVFAAFLWAAVVTWA